VLKACAGLNGVVEIELLLVDENVNCSVHESPSSGCRPFLGLERLPPPTTPM
jgi:hypothetical protein